MRKLFRFLLFIALLSANLSHAQNDIDHWETVVNAEDIWFYQSGTTAPPSNWNDAEFDDSLWEMGQGGMGYGDEDDNTIIEPTLSVFLRIKFDLLDTANINMAVLHADYDDGFVAYLNGIEIGRGNFGDPNSTLAYNEPAPTYQEASLFQGNLPEAHPIYPNFFDQIAVEGENTLAIQVNNHDINSSDLSSNFFLSLGISDETANYGPTPEWFFEPFLSTHLPLVKINTDNQEILDDPRIIAQMQIIDNDSEALNFINHTATDYEGRISLELRGNSSLFFEKKNYSFETQDEEGENNNVSLLGLPPENDWVLHGPYSDKSLIRNAFTFEMGNDLMEYASGTRFCELLINEEYQGVYLLMEKIKRDDSRVDIATLLPEDLSGDEITGGYIIKIDWDDESTDDDGWYSSYGTYPFYAYHHPNYETLHPAQKNYIRNWMLSFEQAMSFPNYESTFENYIDVESFIDYFLINEITKHIDAFKLSFYMYKKKDSNGGKLYMGPIWDFNLGYNNFDFSCPAEPQGWIYPCTSRAFWVNKLVESEALGDLMYCRWQELREEELNTAFLHNRIDSLTSLLGPAIDRNFDRFDILGDYVWPNAFIGETHEEEVNFLKNWLTERLSWMDSNMFGDPSVNCSQLLNQNEIQSKAGLKIYPNPFREAVNVSFPDGLIQGSEIIIYDVLGVPIMRFNPSNMPSYILGNAPSGIYLYEYQRGDELLYRGKLIKSK